MLVLINAYIMLHIHGKMVEERSSLGFFYNGRNFLGIMKQSCVVEAGNGARKLLPNDSCIIALFYYRSVTTNLEG